MNYAKTTHALFATAALALAIGTTPASAEDAYIQSNGANTINTGYHASGKTKISVDFQMMEVKSGNDCVIGHYKAAGQFTLLIYCPNTTSIFAEAKDGAHAGTAKMFITGSTTEYAGSDTARHTIVIDAPGRRSDMYDASGNPEAYYEFPGSWTYNTTSLWPLLLFGASNDANGTPLQPVKAKIYGVKIWETENGATSLVHNYVPAIKGGYPGFYDTETGDFFSNKPSTSAAFTYGGDVLELEDDPYIESDGSAYSVVDTRYFPNNRTKVEVDFQETENVTGDCVFGHYASDYTILIYRPVSDGHYWLVAKDGSYSGLALSPSVSSDTRRHTAVIDIPGRHVELRAPDGGVQGAADLSSKAANWTWNFSTVNNPLMIFGHSTDAYGNSNQRVKSRIYGVRIYENENADGSGAWTKVHDFTPSLRKGVPGFKDTVTGNYVSGGNIVAGGNPPDEDETDPYIDTGTDDLVMSFDTGYYVTSNTCVVCDYMPLKQKTEQQFVFEAGDGTSANNDGKMYMRLYANGSAGTGGISYACGSDQYVVIHPDSSKQIWFAPNVRRKVTLDAYHGTVKMSMNGEQVSEKALAATSRLPEKSATTLKIFSASGGTTHATMARLYSFQIYEEGVLVRDYRPYVQGGIVGLLDIEGDGGFITASSASNAAKITGGGGIAGRTDAYIENNGVTALNLGYKANMATRIEYDFQNLLLGADKVFFGAWNGDVGKLKYCCWNNGGKIKFIFSGNGNGTQNPTGIDTDCKRHTAIMDFKNKALAFVTDGTTNNVTVAGTFSASDTSTQNMGAFAGIAGDGTTSMQSTSRIYAIRIYENDVLVHEFLPYNNGETVSLYDTVTGNVAAKVSSSTATPTINGMGVDGAEKWLKELPATKTVSKDAGSTTLTAAASGAIRYEWTLNGDVLAETGESVNAAWRKGDYATPDIYTCTAIYDVYGVEKRGATVSCAVTRLADAFTIILR